MVVDDVLVEPVGRERALRRGEPQLRARHEPQQVALAAAVRAVAFDDLADIALHLARHGVKVRVEHTVSTDVSDAEILLNYAADLSADLLVIGAYGHSRFREMVMGGVTRTLLRATTVPVLMAH